MDITSLWKDITGIIATIGLVYAWIKERIKQYEPTWRPMVEQFVKDAEEAAKDRIITKDERKTMAMNLVKKAKESGQIKLGWFSWIGWKAISIVINKVAEELPEFVFNKSQ